MSDVTSTDVVNAAIGAGPGSPVAELRARRPDFVQYTQGSHDALVAAPASSGLTPAERAQVALRVAELARHDELAAHYRALLLRHQNDAAAVPDARRRALLDHAEIVAQTPARAGQEAIERLRAAGFSPEEIVTLSQIIAFVSYQARIAFGLALLAGEARS